MEFKNTRLRAGLTQQKTADVLGVSRRTIINWEKRNAPEHARLALSWLAGTAPGWDGFYFQHEYVLTPSGDRVHKSIIDNIEYYAYLNQLIGNGKKSKGLITQGKPHDVMLPINDHEPWQATNLELFVI